MSKIIEGNNGLLHCTVYSHETQILDQVCVEENCANRGLQCERCVQQINNSHYHHHVLSLAELIEQCKTSASMSNYTEALSADQKQLRITQNDIQMHLQNLLKTLQEHVQSAMERLNIQFESDLAVFDELMQAEQKYNAILADLEKKMNNYTSADDAKKKVHDLLLKVTWNEEKRLVIRNVSNDASQKAKQALCAALSAKDNVAQETKSIASDVQAYLDGLIRYVSVAKVSNNREIGSSQMNNSGNQDRRNFHSNTNFGSSLYLQQSSLNYGPTFGANSISNRNIYPNIFDYQGNKASARSALRASSINQRQHTSSTLRFSQQVTGNNDPFLTLHEFERNNENLYSKGIPASSNHLRNATTSASPFKEQSKIVSAASRVNTHNPVVQSYFLGNNNNFSINASSNNNNNNNSNCEDANDSSFIPQEGKVERSYSLTNNITKANLKSMGSSHLQYFQESLTLQPMRNNNNSQLHSRNTAIGPTMAVSSGMNSNKNLNNNSLPNMIQMNQPSNSSSLFNGRLMQSNNNFLLRDGSINHMLGQNIVKTNGNRVWWQAHDGPVRDIVFIDGDKIASGGDDGRVKIWERIEGRLLISLLGHSGGVTCLAYHSGAHILVSGSEDRTIKIWRPVPTWQCVGELKGNGDTVSALRFLSETLVVSGCFDGKIRVYDLEKGEICKYMDHGDSSKVTCLLILGNNRLLAGQNTRICVWDTIAASIVKKQEAHSGEIVGLLLVKGRRSDQQLVISCSKDSQVKLWEASTLILLKSFVEICPIADIVYVSEIDALAVSLIHAKQNQACISLWSLSTLKKVFQLSENNSVANKLLYDSTMKLLYSAHDDQVIQYTKIAQ